MDTHAAHFSKFDTASMLVLDTSVGSVQHQDRYRIHRYVRYHINTGAGHFDKLGATSIPVPGVSVAYRAHRGHV